MALHADNSGFPGRDFRDPRSTPVTRAFVAKGDLSVLIHIAARKRCAVWGLWIGNECSAAICATLTPGQCSASVRSVRDKDPITRNEIDCHYCSTVSHCQECDPRHGVDIHTYREYV